MSRSVTQMIKKIFLVRFASSEPMKIHATENGISSGSYEPVGSKASL